MTKPASHKYRNYIRFLADRLELRDWTFTTGTTHAREGADASVFLHDHKKVGELYLAHNFDDFTPELKRSTLIHELLHMHWQTQHWILRDAQSVINETPLQILDANLLNCEENQVEAFAQAISKFFPTWEDYEAKRKARKKGKKHRG